MEGRIHRSVYKELILFQIFAMVTTICVCADYDLQSAMKLKHLDLEYGERLTSVEQVGRSMLKFDGSGVLPSTRCTTGQPIKVDSAHVPESSGGENENATEKDVQESLDDDDDITTKKAYLAPSPADNPHYIDDER